jgi:hypothetical protein
MRFCMIFSLFFDRVIFPILDNLWISFFIGPFSD